MYLRYIPSVVVGNQWCNVSLSSVFRLANRLSVTQASSLGFSYKMYPTIHRRCLAN
jgi:hypothetical protein